MDRLLRCIHPYHWPATRIDRCWCTTSAAWWQVPWPVLYQGPGLPNGPGVTAGLR